MATHFNDHAPKCRVVEAKGGLGREPINLPGGRLAKIRYAPIATKFRSAAKCRLRANRRH